MNKYISVAFIFFCLIGKAVAGNIIVYNNASSVIEAGKYFEILDDPGNKYDSSSIINASSFRANTQTIPVFSTPDINLWLRFSLTNQTDAKNLYFYLEYYNVSYIKFYKQVGGKLIRIYIDGNATLHSADNSLPNYWVNLPLQKDSSATYYAHIESYHPLVLNTYIGNYRAVLNLTRNQLFTVSVYFGILIVVFLYNLFLFFATGDRNYLVYILYIFFLGLAQFALAGYTFEYFWLSYPQLNYYVVPITSDLATIFGVLFSIQFLRTKFYTPVFHKLLLLTIVLSFVSIIFSLFHNNQISYTILSGCVVLVGILIITSAVIIMLKGYRPALYYAVSWIVFLAGLIILGLRNFNLVPANPFTNYILYVGSAIETVLLSIALADRINVLKKEKEQSQAQALQQARENEQLVSEQNIMLEKKVAMRTNELQTANVQLSDALNNLKDTQTQLVEAEKMASLGQLTAGIAHEINNPINFVKSNINPLRLDVKDLMEVLNAYDELHTVKDHNAYKERLSAIEELKEDMDVPFIRQEIDSLIIGIEEGAERTAEIVRGLRTFSRIDEAALKTVNIHDGILSTIVLLKNNIPFNIKLIKEFNGNSEVECFPGKLNQVFMNVITNAIQAIKSKPDQTDNESITIKTRDIEDNQIEISIKDTGPGMTEDVKHRIFEPFFTTKDVGEGTGLGMAIVFKIIQKHAGKINIITAPNEGAEFIITLPHKYQGVE